MGAKQLVEVRMHHLQEIVDGILRETTPRSMLDHLYAVLGQFGIDRFVMLRFAPEGEVLDKWLVGLRTPAPRPDLSRYAYRDNPRDDPVIRRSRETVEPFYWSDALTPEEKAKRISKVNEALVIPVPSPRGLTGTVWMAGEHTDRKGLHRYKAVLQAIALASYYHIQRHCVTDPADPVTSYKGVHLTSKEHEILGQLANGLSARKIARMLNQSERTVEFHIANMMKKLEAKNRVQAVVLAIRDGLIQ